MASQEGEETLPNVHGGNAGREASGGLLTIAGLNAIRDYLVDWENARSGAGRIV